MVRVLRCFAEGRDGEWEAICLDLDIAVQGRSFDEVFHSLDDAIRLYLESVQTLPEHERKHLLERPAPFSLRLKFLSQAVRALVRDRGSAYSQHQYTVPVAI